MKIDLTTKLLSFTNTCMVFFFFKVSRNEIILLFCVVAIHMLAESSKIYKEGVTMSVKLVKREDLSCKLQKGQHKRVFGP